MQAAAGIRVVVEMLAARVAGLVDAIARLERGRAGRSVLYLCPQMAMSGLVGLVEAEVGFR